MTTIFIDPLELLWITINLVTILMTAAALADALAVKRDVEILNGRAREIAATGNVRREIYRLVVQVLLLTIVVPGLFREAPTPLNITVATLMAIPIVLLVSTLLDARDRRRLTVLVTTDIMAERESSMARLERLIKNASSAALTDHVETNDRIDDAVAVAKVEHAATNQRIDEVIAAEEQRPDSTNADITPA